MKEISARPAEKIEEAVNTYGNMLYRISVVMLKNKQDAEDAVQDTLLKYIQKAPQFEDDEHEKAWLIKVITNRCKDVRRFKLKHPQTEITEVSQVVSEPENRGITEALMKIPEKFRIVMVLYYVQEYKVNEIAEIIGKSPSTVKMRLQKGRVLLKEEYGKEQQYGL